MREIEEKLYNIFSKHIIKKTITKSITLPQQAKKEVLGRLENLTKYRLVSKLARDFFDEIQTISDIDKQVYENLLTMTAYFYYIPANKINEIINEILKIVGDK